MINLNDIIQFLATSQNLTANQKKAIATYIINKISGIEA